MTGISALLAGLGVVAISFGILSALMAILQPYTDPLWIFGNLLDPAPGLDRLHGATCCRAERLTDQRGGERRGEQQVRPTRGRLTQESTSARMGRGHHVHPTTHRRRYVA